MAVKSIAFNGEVEVGRITTTKGKVIYILLEHYTRTKFGEDTLRAITDKNGLPLLFTRKSDLKAYAKKNGLRILFGLNFMAGRMGHEW